MSRFPLGFFAGAVRFWIYTCCARHCYLRVTLDGVVSKGRLSHRLKRSFRGFLTRAKPKPCSSDRPSLHLLGDTMRPSAVCRLVKPCLASTCGWNPSSRDDAKESWRAVAPAGLCSACALVASVQRRLQAGDDPDQKRP